MGMPGWRHRRLNIEPPIPGSTASHDRGVEVSTSSNTTPVALGESLVPERPDGRIG